MSVEPGSTVRWYRWFAGRKRADILDVVVLRAVSRQSVAVRVLRDGSEHTVRTVNLMPAPHDPGVPKFIRAETVKVTLSGTKAGTLKT